METAAKLKEAGMDIPGTIARGTVSDIRDLIDVIGAEKYIDAAKNSTHFFAGQLRQNYFQNIKSSTMIDEVAKSENVWQLNFAYETEVVGRTAALENLKPIAYSGENSWATFIYMKYSLQAGRVEDAIKTAIRGIYKAPHDPRYIMILAMTGFFRGELEIYDDFPFESSVNSSLSELALKLCFISHQFARAQRLFDGVREPSQKAKEIFARSGFSERMNRQKVPSLNVRTYVVAPSGTTSRKRRQLFTSSKIGLDINQYTSIDGSTLGRAISARLWKNADQAVHLSKATGSFLSHLKIWESLTKSQDKGALILEDDCIPLYHPFHALADRASNELDVIFLNERIAPRELRLEYSSIEYTDVQRIYSDSPKTIGADCYYISRRMAALAIDEFLSCGIPEEIDLYLLRDVTKKTGVKPIGVNPAPGEHVDEEYLFQGT